LETTEDIGTAEEQHPAAPDNKESAPWP